MLSDEPKDTAPSEDAPTTKPPDPGDLFEIDLLELFDRYELPIERVAWLCLHWADEIFTKLGEDSVQNLRRHHDFMLEINAMYSSSMRIVDHPDKGRRLVTVAYGRERDLQGYRDWMRLEEHVAALKIRPFRKFASDPKDD